MKIRKKKDLTATKPNRKNDKKQQKASHIKRMKKEAIIQAVLNTFQLNPKAVYNYKQLSKSIGIEAQVQKLYVSDLLYELTCDGILAEVEPASTASALWP